MKTARIICLIFICTFILGASSCGKGYFEEMPKETDLDFWVTENVEDVDMSLYPIQHGWMGSTVYYGKEYTPSQNENGEISDPAHCVKYWVSAYPDMSDGGSFITEIFISDPAVRVRGLTTESTKEEFEELFTSLEYDVTTVTNNIIKAQRNNVTYFLNTTAKTIRITAQASNKEGINY